ncbi:hypothetical protein [Undibacterium sp. Ren11W]|uniref:hypothetical protein n=1 Tax=Undibacterium sp. Ren11W TaxID=3413045 RepID=UPI003BEF8702
MSFPSITEVPDLWNQDGSLRDVYFVDTEMEQWKKFLSFVQDFHYEYSFDGKAQEMLSAESIFLNREGHHILSLNVSGVTVNCHFFVVNEIELDIDPCEIKGQFEHEAILKFIASLSKVIDLSASLTPENGFDTPFLSFDKNEHLWSIHG